MRELRRDVQITGNMIDLPEQPRIEDKINENPVGSCDLATGT